MCVTNPLTKEYCYLPPFTFKLDGISAVLKIVDWDVETDEIMKCMEWGSGSISRPGSGECSPKITRSEPSSPKRGRNSPDSSPPSPCSPCSEPEVGLHFHEIEREEPPKEKKKRIIYSKKKIPYWEVPPFKKCTRGRIPSVPNCTGAPKFNPRWTWNPRDKFHAMPCVRCHSDYCATRFNHPQEFTGNFPTQEEWNCLRGCTTNHGFTIPVYETPAPTHREFQKLLDLPAEKHKEPWLVRGNGMPVFVPPGYIVPGSPKYTGPRSNQNFKDDEAVILLDLNGREIGLGQVWKRKTGDVMDWNPLKNYETAVVVTRSDIDVDLEWERARYFGRKLRKKKIVGSKEVGKGNMMCSLPIRWPTSLLIRPFEVAMAMKCQMSMDHIEGRDDPSFGSAAIANIIKEMQDPVRHPTRQITSPSQDMCYEKCQYGTSSRFIVVIMGYHYLQQLNSRLEEDLVVGVYESFLKKWTFKRLTSNRCRLMPESQGKTGLAILGEDPREMAVIFGGLAMNVKPGREEEEEFFESTLFYCPLYSRRRSRKQYLFHGRKIDPTNCHQLFNFEMWPPIVVQPFRRPGQYSVQAITRKLNKFPEIAETIYIVNVNLDEEMIPTGYFDLLSRMPENNFHELLASATAFTPQYIEHASGEGLIIFKAGHNPKLVIYDVFWDRWIITNYPQQQEGELMKHWQLCEGLWKPNWKQRSGNSDVLLALQP
ncbi:hypothetical protein KC19_3G250700 [Ceratodon purpureus]|nr:hypothetical protein KC19_3G250700 [Ceratodon purpureus]KAG0585012.1 hypothetical protein KC19_3G250700 [Ceratodon purpureus]